MEAPEVALLQEAEDEIEQPRNEGSEESFPGEAQLHLGLSSRQQRHGCSARAVPWRGRGIGKLRSLLKAGRGPLKTRQKRESSSLELRLVFNRIYHLARSRISYLKSSCAPNARPSSQKLDDHDGAMAKVIVILRRV